MAGARVGVGLPFGAVPPQPRAPWTWSAKEKGLSAPGTDNHWRRQRDRVGREVGGHRCPSSTGRPGQEAEDHAPPHPTTHTHTHAHTHLP